MEILIKNRSSEEVVDIQFTRDKCELALQLAKFCPTEYGDYDVYSVDTKKRVARCYQHGENVFLTVIDFYSFLGNEKCIVNTLTGEVKVKK